MDVVREFQQGAVRLHVLHHASAGEVHGAWLSEELARHGHRISPGTLYPLLHRMQTAGLLISRQLVVDGHTRRLYRATKRGRDALTACRAALQELSNELLPTTFRVRKAPRL
ncbi:PadR family transcriptional regulator [Amycolatopsis sp. H20-H5]|uniref:PadR family transcriptional regulator n=1 Tax=Amycolatopsis sp. H20-H5 TaxID=3046309 RepID=UPI002DBDDB95|nr:PadR family transcriptional regulator [Amycolatopsis sp. H20-H5]MEC3974786.1 PadR family transcriptional regulator [Amycolatopsis sp. H20-H5]